MTAAFEVKKRIIVLTKADAAFATIVANDGVWDSAYVDWKRPRQVIWFGEITWEDVEITGLGRPGGRREESFNIRFGIEIHDLDQTQTEANDKAEGYLHALEIMLQDYRQVASAVPGTNHIVIKPVALGEGPNPDGGRAALLAAQIYVRVRN